MKVLFSGIQPTGSIHLGNYLGAIRNWLKLYDNFFSFFSIVNLHSITNKFSPDLKIMTIKSLAMYIACGLDSKKAVLFVQSDVAFHSELMWILSCIVSKNSLNHMTQFKEKSKQNSVVSNGLFTSLIKKAR